MSTIEEKILDGPRVHYCEADNSDLRTGDDADENHVDDESRGNSDSLFVRPDQQEERSDDFAQSKWSGASTNTGPKGVIEDFKNRQLSKEKIRQNSEIDKLDAEFQELLSDDSILKEYISKRIRDTELDDTKTFGRVYRLTKGAELLDAIDKASPRVLVIVHIYAKYSRSCTNLNRCLEDLAQELKHLKFVTLDASATSLSENFKQNGIPALLAYRGGELVKSLVQLEDLLDKNFDATHVKELLIDNGLIS